MKYIARDIPLDEIDLIKGLWEKLNRVHLNDSNYFKEHYKTFTFEKRCENFNLLSPQHIKIQVSENDEKRLIGYCISTWDREVGEIESIFIEEAYRKEGLGKYLLEEAIGWLKENQCSKILLSVAEGHESVIEFYKKMGFYPRRTILELKD